MAVRQRVHAVVQYVSFVVERTHAQFVHFHGIYNVVGRSTNAKFGVGRLLGVSQDIQKLFVTNVLLHEMFLYTLRLLERFRRSSGTHKLYILALSPTNSFGGVDPVSLLNFPNTRRLASEYWG